jgi:hypothetical protein
MFERAFVSRGKITSIYPNGKQPSTAVYMEPFVPVNHKDSKAQVAEYLWVNKALKMLY